jgi:hypothetical protein
MALAGIEGTSVPSEYQDEGGGSDAKHRSARECQTAAFNGRRWPRVVSASKDSDARIMLRTDESKPVRQRFTEKIHMRKGRVGLRGASRDENRVRKTASLRPSGLKRHQMRDLFRARDSRLLRKPPSSKLHISITTG